MFQVLGPTASPPQKIVLPSSSPGQIEYYMKQPLDDYTYISSMSLSTTASHLPTPTRKVGRPRKNRAGVIAIVPPSDSTIPLPAASGPQTPPPTASREHHDLPRSQIPVTPQSNQRRTTGSKTVPRPFITPQSSSRPHTLDLSLSSNRPWSSSSPLTSPGENGLGIFVNQGIQPPHDVDPSMIYPDQKEVQAANMHSTYTTLFRSPIQYPPYLGKRSLSDFAALSSSAMYGTKERKRASARTRSQTDEYCKSLSPTTATQPPTPASIICFTVSETGQAIIECKESPAMPATPGLHSRMLSSSTSISTLSSSTSPSLSDDHEADEVSEAETEIFNSKGDGILHNDARVAMAKVIRRQQSLLQQYREQLAGQEQQKVDSSERKRKHPRTGHHHRKLKLHDSSGEIVSREKSPASSMDFPKSSLMAVHPTQFTPGIMHQESFASQPLRAGKVQRLHTQPLGALHDQPQLQQSQAQQLQMWHSPAEDTPKDPPKRKRGRPPKKQELQYKGKDGDGVTRCVCGYNDWFGTPMVQCDSCTCWLHMSCVNLDPRLRIVGAWYCPLCTCGVPARANY
ncbi:hypothetical protein POJ06DRAFT_249342 [Lipomyces tetrasporus]|uniref:PHD-type domain-containing protein n=1 Tax=Lipomyces tetrasporus TaxID=54092 RepID=A0AAD7VVK5_9ASCO|nr:uncharacterized protein POJ06DRAFT_249342 [Lipomyces tetrasporus]KAJ8102310.1 hypothetical protein POJ06DRAFT_249342 [Lipomyces tetrasporus]